MENKQSNKKLVIVSILALLIVGSGSLFYYLKNQIKPKELKKTIVEKLEESIPGADVTLGELKVNYGTSFTVDIKGMDILLKESLVSKRDFLQVSHITVKLPLWSLLTGGGNLEVYLKKPELFLFKPVGNKGNWNIAFNSKPNEKKALEKKSAFSGSHNIILPAFLINSTAAFRLSDFKVYYDISDKAGVWSASKLILKNVGLTSNAAFEIESNFKRVIAEDEKFSFDTVLIGSVELEKYLKTGKLHINSSYKVKNLKTREHPTSFSLIRGNTSINVDKSGALEGTVTSLFQESELSAEIKASKDLNEINFTKSNIKLSDVATFLPDWKKNFNLSKSYLLLDGKLTLNGDGSLSPKLKFKLSDVTYLKKAFPYSFTLSGSFVEKELKAAFDGSIWQGQLLGKIEADLDINSDDSLEKRVSFFSGDLNFKNNQLSVELLLPDEEHEKSSEGNILLPKGILAVNFENLQIQKYSLTGGFTLKSEMSTINLNNGVILEDDGKVSFESEAKIFKEEITWDHEISFKKANSKFLELFFPQKYPFVVAKVDGKLEGSFVGHPLRSKEIKLELSAPQGEFVRFDSGLILKALEDTTTRTSLFYKEVNEKGKPYKESQNFQNLNLNFLISSNEHHIKRLDYTDSKGHKVFISGFVDPSKETKKRIIVQFEGSESFQKNLKKKTKLKRLPLSFFTKGYDLSVDSLYPLNQLARKFRFKKDRNKTKKEIIKVKAEIKRKQNEKS